MLIIEGKNRAGNRQKKEELCGICDSEWYSLGEFGLIRATPNNTTVIPTKKGETQF